MTDAIGTIGAAVEPGNLEIYQIDPKAVDREEINYAANAAETDSALDRLIAGSSSGTRRANGLYY